MEKDKIWHSANTKPLNWLSLKNSIQQLFNPATNMAEHT